MDLRTKVVVAQILRQFSEYAIGDDGYREDKVEEATIDQWLDLVAGYMNMPTFLLDWLANRKDVQLDEYQDVTNIIMAAESAKVKLERYAEDPKTSIDVKDFVRSLKGWK